MNLQQTDAGLTAFLKALEISPDLTVARVNYGWALANACIIASYTLVDAAGGLLFRAPDAPRPAGAPAADPGLFGALRGALPADTGSPTTDTAGAGRERPRQAHRCAPG